MILPTETQRDIENKAADALIGAILLDNEALWDARDLGVTPISFPNAEASTVFRAMCHLQRRKQEIDLLTVTAELESMQVIGSVFPDRRYVARYLSRTIDGIPAPDSAAIKRYYRKMVGMEAS